MPSKGNQSDLAVVGRMVGVACCVVGWLCEARCGVQSKPASPAAFACVEGGGPWPGGCPFLAGGPSMREKR